MTKKTDPSPAPHPPDRLQVVSAVIVRNGRILLTQRDPMRSDFGMKWETAGGKVNPGETLEAAMVRELREELGVEATVIEEIGAIDLDPPVLRVPTTVSFFTADIGDQTPRPLEAVGIGWFGEVALSVLDLTPACEGMRHELDRRTWR